MQTLEEIKAHIAATMTESEIRQLIEDLRGIAYRKMMEDGNVQ
jgi:hypothetical protein